MNLAVPVIRTKIIIPRRRTEILSRPRLLSILENVLDLKLLILAAPAGYGKTSLLIDFAYHTQLPVCWFAIDAMDSDPQRFISHFIAAIANCFPSFGEASRAALGNLDQDSLNLDPVISAIINDIYEHISEHFIFVLDDYHLVRDSKPIDEFINRITLEVSENCHLVISSRTLLTLPDLTLLVARSQVGGLSYEELAFLPEEIKQFFSMNYHQNISEEIAADLVNQTEGWITGLLLTAQLSPEETINRLRLARVSGIGLYEYLAKQVLEEQPEELILFLKRTSLLEEFDANLCERIFSQVPGIEKQNWRESIELLLRENLFVLPVDDETLHLRYHHLFRDFLQNDMRSERSAEAILIETHLAEYYEDCKEWERAFAIYSRIGNPDQIVSVIIRAAPSMILGGRLISLSTWLEAVPEQIRNTRPELLSISGTIALIRGDIKSSLHLLNSAISGLAKNPEPFELTRALIRRSTLNRFIGSYEDSKEDAENAVKLCRSSADMEKLEAEALRAVGLSDYQSGDVKNALITLSASLDKYSKLGEEMDAANVLIDLGLVYLTQGQLDEADSAYHKSLGYWQETQNSLLQAHLSNNIGIVQHLRGKYEQAVFSFEKAIQHSRLSSNPRAEGFSLTSLGDLYRDIRALPEARRAYQMAREASKSVNDQTLRVLLSLSEASLERLTGDMEESARHLNTALTVAQKGGSKFEINVCKLEQCIASMTLHQFAELIPVLKELVEYFSEEGFHLEEIRARYYLALVSVFVKKDAESEAQLDELIEVNLNAPHKSPFMQMGFETLSLLDEYFEKTGASKWISFYMLELKEFETALVPLRRTIRRHSEIVQFSTPKLVIRSFGKLQVRIGEHNVALSEWKTQTVRDIFFYVLLHPDGVTKEEIGAAFWPDSTMEALRLRFKNSIYRLRHALGSESIIFVDDYYRFNRSLEYDYDAEEFLQELTLAQSESAIEDKISHYRSAVNSYHGAYLPKLEYEWVAIQREQYHRLFMDGIKNLINLLLETRQYETAIHFAERALGEDPCFEEAYRLSMTAFFAMGDRAAVSRQYEKCRSILKKELDLEPAPQTEDLYKKLLQ